MYLYNQTMQRVRWGIVGTGRMATTMAKEISGLSAQNITLTAISSRELNKARSLAERYGALHAWDNTADLARDPDVDVIYVATPHSSHCDDMFACLRADKAVLCEKPFTLNAFEAQQVITTARSRKVFAMEAMWTRFLPAIGAVRDLLAGNAIGRVNMIVGGGAFIPEFDAKHYLFNKNLGGGVLLDAGVYLISMASMILGTPTQIRAIGSLGRNGVDEQDSIALEFDRGASALLYVSLRARRPPDLEILGDAGRIRIAAPVFRPTSLTLSSIADGDVTHEFPIAGSGYSYQIRAVSDALRAGQCESALMPLHETLSIMQTMDTIRAQIGLQYPNEKR